MIVESKILLELDVPTVSGYIYPKELSIPIIQTIHNEYIGGDIYISPNIPNPETITPKFRILNPTIVVDSTVLEPELVILCDVELDEEKISPSILQLLQQKPWRLSIVGKGEVENNIVKTYELKYVNIEIIENL